LGENGWFGKAGRIELKSEISFFATLDSGFGCAAPE
jgi:hypothetical protein